MHTFKSAMHDFQRDYQLPVLGMLARALEAARAVARQKPPAPNVKFMARQIVKKTPYAR